MIQRIQSVYLFIVFVFALLAIFLPVGTLEISNLAQIPGAFVGEVVIKLTGVSLPEGITQMPENSPLGIIGLIMAFLVMGISVYTILQFKNRQLQVQLCKFLVMLLAGQLIVSFYYADHYKLYFTGYEINYGLAIFLPLLSMILPILALKAIKRDIVLVKSADRIR
ncbi:MAG TPA: hypothetical protein DCM62_00645 [Bacteroidales bacterium]|nr:hypothetical protein [Bacteroidales bacterium]